MRLSTIVIRNFKPLKNVSIKIPSTDPSRPGSADFVSLIGPNNHGKSSVLEALRLICPDTDLKVAEQDLFFGHAPSENPIEVELHFENLSQEDRQKHAIRARFDGDSYKVKKKWTAPKITPERYSYSQLEEVRKPEGTGRQAYERDAEWKPILDAYEGLHGKFARLDAGAFQKLTEFVVSRNDPVVSYGDQNWNPNPGGLPSNLDTILPRVIHVPAIRETADETTKANGATRQIVKTLFDLALARHPKIQAFKDASANVQKLFSTETKHGVVSELEGRISRRLQRLIDIDAELLFSPPDLTADLASNTALFTRDRRSEFRGPLKPEHQGHGAQRALILALLEELAASIKNEDGYRPPILLLIEEPEIYLHPEMCRKMRDALLSIARSGTAQVICTTHSPVFLDLADRHDGIVRFCRNSESSIQVHQLDHDLFADKQEMRNRLRMILNFDASANEVFFASNVCLVEGDCELAALAASVDLLSKDDAIDRVALDRVRRETAFVNCRGKWTIRAFQNVLAAFRIPYRVIHDKDEGQPALANPEIAALAANSDSQVRIHEPNFEGEIAGQRWTTDKAWSAWQWVCQQPQIQGKLKEFFEFAFSVELEQLASTFTDATARSTPAEDGWLLKCRNCRDALPVRILRREEFSDGHFEIAAGRARTPQLDQLCTHAQGGRIVAKVIGDSMADTLLDGDFVELESVDVMLSPIGMDQAGISIEDFGERIESGAVYAVAINDDYDQHEYTLKRVFTHRIDGTSGWLCRISADNPNSTWGDRGQMIVRAQDRVHFAAKLLGLAQFEVPNETRSEQLAEIEDFNPSAIASTANSEPVKTPKKSTRGKPRRRDTETNG